MEKKQVKISAHMITAERQLAQELNGLTASCATIVTEENKKLIYHLLLIDEAIASCTLDKWMTVWSVLNNLTDGNEVKKMTDYSNPTSRFHKNMAAVNSLTEGLYYWLKEEVILNQDTLIKVSTTLTERLVENKKSLVRN